MAKVTMPLMSVGASGKLADSIVFFGWKGINVVRQWLKPANPQSAGQGDARIIMGGTGRCVGTIQPSSAFHQQLIDLNLIPGGQTKQSYLVKYVIEHYLDTLTNYTAQLALCTGHTAYSEFGSLADSLSIVEFDLAYADAAPYDKALGLYLLAKAAIALSFTGSPYDTALADWTATEVGEMGADFTAA
jgi:hypothetical protein